MEKIKNGTMAELILNENTNEVEVIFYDRDTKKEIMRFPFVESTDCDNDYKWINTSKESIQKAIKKSASSIIGEIYTIQPLDKPE